MTLKANYQKGHLWFILSIVVLGIDLLTKYLTDGIVYKDLIPKVVSVQSYHNTGASFSLFAGSEAAGIIFLILGILVSLFILLYAFFSKNKNLNFWFFVGASLMVAGILGNVVDRICFGYVRDFIALLFMKFAVFNVADMALCVGTIFVAVWLLFYSYKGEKDGNKDISNK